MHRRCAALVRQTGVTLLLAGAADAQPGVEVVWTATSGYGTTGGSTIQAANGDVLQAEVRLSAGPEGIAGYSVSLEFDTALDDELDLVAASGVTPAGFDMSSLPNPASSNESSGSVAGRVSSFNATCLTLPCGPVNSTFVAGTVTFQVKNVADDGSDVFSGLFNLGTDVIYDGSGNDISGSATYAPGQVDVGTAPPPEVPFAGAQTIASGISGPYQTRAADLDGDGDLDLLVAYSTGNRLSWYRNTDGAGTFVLAQDLSTTATNARGIEAVDVDGDGDFDVVATAQGADLVAWFENTDGAGTFGSQQTISTAHQGAWGLASGDLDRDGDLDLAVCSVGDDELAWFENDGAGSFARHLITSSATGCLGVAVADLDRDGWLDLLTAESSQLAWYRSRLGQTTHDFAAAQQVYALADPIFVAVADVDRDGDLDPLAATQNGLLAWYPNSDATFGVQSPIATGDAPSHVSVGDVDQDGDLDVIAHQDLIKSVEWYENAAGDASSWTPHWIGTGVVPVEDARLADLDGDGDPDLVACIFGATPAEARVEWYENRTIHRSVYYPARQQVVTLKAPGRAEIGDVDRDGDLDFLVGSVGTDQVLWVENTAGNASAWTQHVIGSDVLLQDPRSISLADVDGDGDPDALAAGVNGGVGIYTNLSGDGSSWSAFQQLCCGQGNVVTADFDRDGDVDVVSLSNMSNIYYWSNDGDGSSWTFVDLLGSVTSPNGMDEGDVDGDGDMDVLVAGNGSSTTVAWKENALPGGNFISVHSISGSVDSGTRVAGGDLDGDGDLDAVSYKGVLAWHENTAGDGSAWTRTAIPLGSSCSSPALTDLAVADLDADGDLDLVGTVVGASNCAEVRWYENAAGDASVWTSHAGIGVTVNAFGMAVGDLNGDGVPDLISGHNDFLQNNWVNVHLGRAGQFELATTNTAPAYIFQATADDVLAIDATHKGRTGDSEMELVSLELLFESWPGIPYASGDANALIDSLQIYADDGSGVFESGSDTLVTTVDTLALTSGVQTVSFPDGAPGAAVAAATTRRYFVALQLTADAGDQPYHIVRVTHHAPNAMVEDATYDVPLSSAPSSNVVSGLVYAFGGSSDADGDQLTDLDELNVYGTDPFDYDTDGDFLQDGWEVSFGTSPTNPDTDADGFCDGAASVTGCTGGDNCPLISNGAQTNSDAAPAGDVCQCGDVGGSAGIDASDLAAVREYLVGRTPSGGAPDLDRCDVNADGDCDVEDVFVLERFVNGADVYIENGCAGYSTP